ncbi:MAG: HD family phosphohydrolase [Clostridia bacterium]|nr:HD family phosphohydrolase [Clostridia bacterium]
MQTILWYNDDIKEKESTHGMIKMEFYRMVRDIVKTDEFLQMKHYKHHVKGSVYDHSVKVAYLCYLHHKRFGTKIDLAEFVRGALLHDYYLYDWHDMAPGRRLHLFTHPKAALKNATEHYPELTAVQRDMIRSHMFPITPHTLPKTKAGWLICFYDKVAAFSDYFGKNKWKMRERVRIKKTAVPA